MFVLWACFFFVLQTRSKIDIYSGLVNNYDQLHGWASDKCMPLVREITFNNAEVRMMSLCFEHASLFEVGIGLVELCGTLSIPFLL